MICAYLNIDLLKSFFGPGNVDVDYSQMQVKATSFDSCFSFPLKEIDQQIFDANSTLADPGGDFFIENVMEELDYPGEFFFDTRAQKLYLYHNGAPRRKRR